jgi:glycosyltransferase involved in cell wall biosynthesis
MAELEKNISLLKNSLDQMLLEREDLRKNFNMNNKLVIGFVGRNQRRKMLPILFSAFSQFSKNKNDVCLLLHTELEALPGWDLNCLMAKYSENDPNLKDKLKMTKDHFSEQIRQLIQPRNMNEIYNLMDYECHAVGGEGFGLPCIEAQSAGVPLIMTNYSTGQELTQEGILIPVLKDEYGRIVQEIGQNGIGNAIPNDKELSKIFEEIYIDWKNGGIKLKERKEKARQFALTYDWDNQIPKWFELFEKNLE